MTGHGGARKGAGRKAVEPDLSERLVIGARCEEIRAAVAMKAALAKSDAKIPERVRQLQSLILANREKRSAAIQARAQAGASRQSLRAMAAEFKRYDDHALARVKGEITPSLDRVGRHTPVKPVRIMTRDMIMKQVAKECREAGRPLITARRVKAYWTEYGKFLKVAQAT